MPKKGENIYKRKDGRWEARYVKGRRSDGRIQYGYIYAKSYKEAKQKKMSIQSDTSTVLVNAKKPSSENTFSDWSDQWLNHKKNRIKISSYIKYTNLLTSYITPFLGEKNIEEINSYIIENWIDTLISSGGNSGKGISDKTVGDAVFIVKSVLQHADRVDQNLKIQRIDVTLKHNSPELHILTREDQCVLTNYLIENSSRKNMGILISLFTGIRVGELCALKMCDINMNQKYIYVHGTMQRIKNDDDERSSEKKTHVVVMSPKSKSSIRQIPIPDCLIDIIKEYNSTDDSFFLTGKTDKIIEPRAMQYHFKRVLSQCNIESI